ncbi:PBECR4 domain-containing protein [Muricomes intestini]|uniref:PBECR4 domain-containing protein n=1 Tax=Muricomes intestini TaxID=1796634 RepID=UPI001FA99A58|nr:PBECR4 domain-containing protein [Muricomes intestini]
MNLLKQSALAWKEITEYRYLLTYGYKKKLYAINLTFSPEDYPHLAGFQYMKDISLPNFTSAKIIDRILDDKITFEKIQEAAQYEEMIKPILHQIPIYIITIKYFPALHTFSDSIPSYGIPICPSYVPQMPNHP